MPDELSVIGFADLSVASLADPPLTTVAQPVEQMGRAATRLILNRLTSVANDVHIDDSPVEQTLPTSLVVRQSTAPPRNP
jgi:LacI family transcriptional regulator